MSSFAELLGHKAVEGLEPWGEGVVGAEVVEVPIESTAGIVMIPRLPQCHRRSVRQKDGEDSVDVVMARVAFCGEGMPW